MEGMEQVEAESEGVLLDQFEKYFWEPTTSIAHTMKRHSSHILEHDG